MRLHIPFFSCCVWFRNKYWMFFAKSKFVLVKKVFCGKTCNGLTFWCRGANVVFVMWFVDIVLFQVFENYTVDYKFESTQYTLSLHDTAGHEEYDRLRPLTYAAASIFLLCYSVIDRKLFQNISEKVNNTLHCYTVLQWNLSITTTSKIKLLPVIYSVMCFNEGWWNQFTLANNVCLLELI